MSQQKGLTRETAAAMSSGAPDRISDWFTEDFRLHEPGKPALSVGHEGARQVREASRQNRMRAGVETPAKVEILDMIEEGDRVTVRWQVTATARDGNPYERSILAIYRFESGRIAEDWGIGSPTRWPRVPQNRSTGPN
jgi:ketosteroid isomerase-like protein